jgi:hypothetical protein
MSMKLFTNLQIYTEQDYAVDWDAPAFLENNGYQLNNTYQEGLQPIATLIGGRNGSWARFINQSGHDGTHNVEFWPLAMRRKYRIIVWARRDIQFGEEITTFYGEKYGEILKNGQGGQVLRRTVL